MIKLPQKITKSKYCGSFFIEPEIVSFFECY